MTTTHLDTIEWDGTVAPALSGANQARVYYDLASNTLRLSENGGAYRPIAGLVSNTFQGDVPAITGARRVLAANTAGTAAAWNSALLADESTTGSPNAAAVVQPVNTAGSPTALRVTGGAHTTLDAGVEAQDVAFALARTVQFNTGALTAQRAFRVTAPTYGFVAASTITDAATLAVSGPPIVGTNATITRAHALWIETGYLGFGANAGTTAATVAASGMLWPHPFVIRARNNANSVDRDILRYGVLAADLLEIGQANVTMRILGDASTRVLVAGTERWRWSATTLDFNNGSNANYNIAGNAEVMLGFNIAAAGVRNLAFFNDGSANMQGMDGGLYFLNVVAAPGADPVGGGYMFSNAGAGTWHGTGGTITAFGPAEPHCKRCGRDFAIAVMQNKKYGKLAICAWCLTDALERHGVPEDEYIMTKEAA